MNKTYANGIFLFIALIIFGIMIFYVDDFALLREKKHIYALFDHIDALADGSLVYYNGVNVGSVRGIEFWDRKIKVRLSFKADIMLHENIIIKIKTGGLVGEKYIDISSPPGKTGKILTNGETIHGSTGESFDSLINTFENLASEMSYSFKKINAILDKSENNINKIFENTQKSTEKIPDLLTSLEEEIKQIGDEMENVLKSLGDEFSEISPELKESLISVKKVMNRLENILKVVDDKKDSLGESIENFEGITSNVLNISKRINNLIGEEGTSLGSLITPFDRENTNAEYVMS
ncbi:MAG: MlaD family protein, partial [Candidatus Muiribacteriota bacterium]